LLTIQYATLSSFSYTSEEHLIDFAALRLSNDASEENQNLDNR